MNVVSEWILPIIGVVLLSIFFIAIVAYLITRMIKYIKIKKRQNAASKGAKYELDSLTINMKVLEATFTRSKDPDNIFAWYALTQLLTSVLSNSFDERGSFKGVLDSIYNIFQNLKNKLENSIDAYTSINITLVLLNKIFRPFLSEWNQKINYKKDGSAIDWKSGEKPNLSNDDKRDFVSAYNNLKKKIIDEKIMESYGELCGLKISCEFKNKNLDTQRNNVDIKKIH